MKDPSDLAYLDLLEVVRTIQATLWPRGDAEHQWDASTIESVAGILTGADLGPYGSEKAT